MKLSHRQKAMIAGFRVVPRQQLLRGHPIVGPDVEGNYVYVDDNTPTTERRDCGRCGKPDTPEGHDPCLGTVEGVVNACCGHGDVEQCYVVLEDGLRIEGREAESWLVARGVTRWRTGG